MYLLEHALQVGREGIEDLGAQAAGDVVDVVEQLRGGTFRIGLKVDQARVQGAQLLVRLEGCFIRCLELCLGVFAAYPSADGGPRVICSGPT